MLQPSNRHEKLERTQWSKLNQDENQLPMKQFFVEISNVENFLDLAACSVLFKLSILFVPDITFTKVEQTK